MIALSVVERPGAVAAEQADDLARADGEMHPAQDVALAVVRVELFDLEQPAHATSSPR